MAKTRTPVNPFYFLLVICGIVFLITVCAYFVMALRGAEPTSDAAPHGLIGFLEKHGVTALTVELIALALTTVGAIGLDDYRQRKTRTQSRTQRDGRETP